MGRTFGRSPTAVEQADLDADELAEGDDRPSDGPDGPGSPGPLDDGAPAAADRAGDDQAADHRRAGHWVLRLLGLYLGVAVTYLVLAVAVWWHVWSTHPTSTATCGCGDPALFMSFLEWPAYALAHGQNPFFTTAVFHPTGMNMLAQTSVVAIGLPLAPVTWIFGPVATLNVAATLSPVLSGLAAFWLIRRYVSWAPAAWLGGLLYGFSPSLLVSLAFGHLMTSLLVIPPLIVGALDELLVRQRRRPPWVGLGLGVLIAVQFFVSTELVIIMAVCILIGLVLLVGYGLVADRPGLVRRLPGALTGGAVAVVVSVALLAYPAWYALKGPAHLSGPIWPNLPLGGFFLTSFVNADLLRGVGLFQISGYFGAVMSSTFLGWGLIGVLAAGTVVFWRDRRLWFYGAMALITAAVSLTVAEPFWDPWKALQHLPQFMNIIEERFSVAVYLAVAVMLAIVVDRTRSAAVWDRLAAVTARGGARSGERGGPAPAGPDVPAGGAGMPAGGPDGQTDGSEVIGAVALADLASPSAPVARPTPPGRPARRRPLARVLGALAALAVAAVALVPVIRATAATMPFETQTVHVPKWFATTGTRLPGHQVLLILPVPFSGLQSALAWQAIDGMRFAQAGGGGPQGVVTRAGAEKAGFSVLRGLAFNTTQFPLPDATPASLAATRQALSDWKVTGVVDPDQPATLQFVIRGNDPVYSANFMTAALGTMPTFVHGAWVWLPIDLATPALVVPPGTVGRCTAQAEHPGQGPLAGPACVMAAATGR